MGDRWEQLSSWTSEGVGLLRGEEQEEEGGIPYCSAGALLGLLLECLDVMETWPSHKMVLGFAYCVGEIESGRDSSAVAVCIEAELVDLAGTGVSPFSLVVGGGDPVTSSATELCLFVLAHYLGLLRGQSPAGLAPGFLALDPEELYWVLVQGGCTTYACLRDRVQRLRHVSLESGSWAEDGQVQCYAGVLGTQKDV